MASVSPSLSANARKPDDIPAWIARPGEARDDACRFPLSEAASRSSRATVPPTSVRAIRPLAASFATIRCSPSPSGMPANKIDE
jgi:hypothetical protein